MKLLRVGSQKAYLNNDLSLLVVADQDGSNPNV